MPTVPPDTSPPRSSIYRTAERGVGGDLRAFLTDERAKGTSFSGIASVLQDHNVIVSYETVRAWCIRLGVEA